MRDQSLRGHIKNLEQQGELIRINEETDPKENVSTLGWKTYDQLGKSTLYTRLKGYPGWQLCSQIVTDRRKWGIGLGIPKDDVIPELVKRIKCPLEPVVVKNDEASVKEVIYRKEDCDLTALPAMWTSEQDPGPYIAAGMAVIKDPESGGRNLSYHRQQVLGPDRTGFLICPRHAQRIYRKYQERGEDMPIAIVIGAHPSILFAAGYTTAFGHDEIAIAGGLIEDPIRLVKCETSDLEVPAEAEIILEGKILAHGMTDEGPFGEVTGGYAMEGSTEIFEVTCITHRRDPVFYGMHSGAPMGDPQSITGTCIEVALHEHLSRVEGGMDILDIRCLGISGLMAVVLKIRPKVPGQAKTALMAALSGPYMHPKIAIAVDEDIDASDLRQVFWSLTTRVDAERDLIQIPNTRIWSLDNISDIVPGMSAMYRIGSKTLIDATKPSTSHPNERARFQRAMPKNFDTVNLADFL
ncbi:MAG: UbiD family decarboxylase [Rhodospirillaceae bacterium]